MNREIDQDLPWASRHRAWLLFWGILAAANLGAGLAISRWAERQSDLRRVAEWCALWTQGVNVYGLRAEFVDYPPHAIVLLSPLAWVQSFEHLVGVWAAANLMLAVTAAYLAVRLVRPGASLHAAAVPVLMFLTWGGFRTLLQFSLLALTLGLAATVLANRRPIVSGVLLGLSLIKPQVAIPFVLWAVFERRWRQISVAIGTMSAGYVAVQRLERHVRRPRCARLRGHPPESLHGRGQHAGAGPVETASRCRATRLGAGGRDRRHSCGDSAGRHLPRGKDGEPADRNSRGIRSRRDLVASHVLPPHLRLHHPAAISGLFALLR